MPQPQRKVIHIDMDAFYASVEQRDRPELRGKPVIVGGTSARGVVCAASYEARAFGVRSAMPAFRARALCPQLVALPVDMAKYRAESARVRRILDDYSDLIEPLSLDEAYLDVSHHRRYAWDIAREIRARVVAETGLTSSCGIAHNKLLAKISSDWRKPDGQFAVTPDTVDAFMPELPVRKLRGVGPKTFERLRQMGITLCGELQQLSLGDLVGEFGSFGHELHRQCRGIDDRPVAAERLRKSLSNERTFSENKTTLGQWHDALETLHAELIDDLRRHDERLIHKLFVRVKYLDFTRRSRECVATEPAAGSFRALLDALHEKDARPIRLMGCGVRFSLDSAVRWVQEELPLEVP